MGQNCTLFKIWLHFGPFLGNMTCWRTNIPPVFKRLPPKIHKKYPKLWNISKKWPNMHTELLIMGQNRSIFKISLLFGTFLWNIKCLTTIFKGFYGWFFDFDIFFYQEITPKTSQIWNIVQFDPFCSILRSCWAIFWKYNIY